MKQKVILSGIFIFLQLFFLVSLNYGQVNDAKMPYISEFMALNSTTITDENGDYSDWIEIHNPTAQAINLKGWFLTDDSLEMKKWTFPEIQLTSDSYIIVFASGDNKTDPAKKLHTNFKLSGSGEYLALVEPDGKTKSCAFSPSFPEQYPDVSYGLFNSEWQYFTIPTPGKANSTNEYLPPPNFNVERGFYTSPFELKLTTDIEDATIIYTTDGSKPQAGKAKLYGKPIPIKTTTCVRAVVMNYRNSESASITHTYIFLSDVVKQSNSPAGYPSLWGPYAQLTGNTIADYEMDPAICNNPLYAGKMNESLLSLPTLSVVTRIGNLFSHSTDPDTGGIYIYTAPPTGGIGENWEREASVEYIIPNSANGFQINCGLQLHGGHSRLPEKSPKHSFRLSFKDEYGSSKLEYKLFDYANPVDKFDNLVLRAGFGNTWHHHASIQRKAAQYMHDSWAKDTQLAMNHFAAHNSFAHLYINGLYWGIYNISERLNDKFMEAYMKGAVEDYDIIKDYAEVTSGNIDAWNAMMKMANAGLADKAAYQKIQGNNPDGTPNPNYVSYLDVENLIDYMLINFYGGNTDWDHHNWTAARNRTNPGKGFKFFIWDAEMILTNENIVNENNDNRPSRLYTKLRDNEEFRLLFADHVNKHFFNDGVFTPQAVIDRWQRRAATLESAVISESARWGDYRRDVHQHSSGPYEFYTPDYWTTERNRLVKDYFPVRTQTVINQLKAANLYPLIDAPIFNKHGGTVDANFEIQISAATGTVYYTTDGRDPRLTGGAVAGFIKVYSASPFKITEKTVVKARVKTSSGWSALTEATFYPSATTGIEDQITTIEISGNYPNPFADLTTIYYTLPIGGNVNVSVYTIDGRLIETIQAGYQWCGKQSIVWHPAHLQNGIYFFRISCGTFNATGRLIKVSS